MCVGNAQDGILCAKTRDSTNTTSQKMAGGILCS